jgi:hypothetical protein
MWITDMFMKYFHRPNDPTPTLVLDNRGRMVAMGIPGKAPMFFVERLADTDVPVIATIPNSITDMGIKYIIPVVANMNENNAFSCAEGGARLGDMFKAMGMGRGMSPDGTTDWDNLPGGDIVKAAHARGHNDLTPNPGARE